MARGAEFRGTGDHISYCICWCVQMEGFVEEPPYVSITSDTTRASLTGRRPPHLSESSDRSVLDFSLEGRVRFIQRFNMLCSCLSNAGSSCRFHKVVLQSISSHHNAHPLTPCHKLNGENATPDFGLPMAEQLHGDELKRSRRSVHASASAFEKESSCFQHRQSCWSPGHQPRAAWCCEQCM